MTLAMLQMLGQLVGIPAAVARIAVVGWLALFCAFDSVAGIATGVLVDGGFADAATYLFDHGLVGGGSILGWVAQPMWIVVAVASGLALRSNGEGRVAWTTMLASALFATHAGWVAALGLIALGIALWIGIGRPSRAPSRR